MGDKQVGKALLSLKPHKQVYNLCLDGYVQSGDRFIADDKLRIHGESSGNPDPLPLSSRKFVDKTGGVFHIQPHSEEKLLYSLPLLLPASAQLMGSQALSNNVMYLHLRIQRGVGILENNLYLLRKCLLCGPS